MVVINGTEYDAAGKILAQFLEEKDYHFARIAVEVNGDIVPRALYGQTVFKDGDSVEVVSFVGGG